jgi:hypothetical protein
MKNRTLNQYEKYGKKVLITKSQRGWAIVIRPDNLRVDNYRIETHMHFHTHGKHFPIKFKEMETVGLIIDLHIEKNKGINKDKLTKELIL